MKTLGKRRTVAVKRSGGVNVEIEKLKRDLSREENADGLREGRMGVVSRGSYPDINRTKLAALVGKHPATVSNYLTGRIRMPLSVAVRVAELVGVSVEELERELSAARVETNGTGIERGEK